LAQTITACSLKICCIGERSKMARKKKPQQHIGHDPLAWLAEGEPVEPTPQAATEATTPVAETSDAETATTQATDAVDVAAEPAIAEAPDTDAVSAASEQAESLPNAPAAVAPVETATEDAATEAAEPAPAAAATVSEVQTADSALEPVATTEADNNAAAEVLDAAAEDLTEPEPATEDISSDDTNPAPLSPISGWQTVTLPTVLTLSELPAVYEELNALLGQRIRLSGGQVTRIDTAGLQLLVALMEDEDTTIGWLDASETLCQSAHILGLNQVLNLAEFETAEL
jgi:ABC-type transporter Mla MlaB component